MEYHHSAFMISLGSSSVVQEFCEFMGAKLVWEGFDQGREIAMQFPKGNTLQFSEVREVAKASPNKQETHIAFSTATPRDDLVKLEQWFSEHKLETKTGQWSDTEVWIDCPSVFVNFVIELLIV